MPETDPGTRASTSADDSLVEDIDQTFEEALTRELHPVSVKHLPGAAQPGLPRRGSLATSALPLLLGTAYRMGQSGRLLIERQGQQHALDLDCGQVVTVTSSDPELGLLAMLVRQGRISAEDRERVRGEALLGGRRPGAILVDLGYLKSAELLPALRRQQEEILLTALGFSDGSFSFDAEVRAEPAQIRIHRHPLALVRAGLARRSGATADLVTQIGGQDARLSLVGGAAALDVLDQAAFEPGDRRMLALFDGLRPLQDIIRRSELPEPSAVALAFALWAGGHLVPVDDPHRKRILRDRRLDRERIVARAALCRAGDYFEVLGVSPAASAAQIASAVGQLEQDIQAVAGDPDLQAGLQDEIESLRLVTEEAARVLGDDRLRALYQAALGR